MRAGSTPSGTRLLLKNEATGGEYRNQTGPTKAAGILALRRPHVIPWARSSAGRARESHSRGQGFESPRVHSCHLSRHRRRGRMLQNIVDRPPAVERLAAPAWRHGLERRHPELAHEGDRIEIEAGLSDQLTVDFEDGSHRQLNIFVRRREAELRADVLSLENELEHADSGL